MPGWREHTDTRAFHFAISPSPRLCDSHGVQLILRGAATSAPAGTVVECVSRRTLRARSRVLHMHRAVTKAVPLSKVIVPGHANDCDTDTNNGDSGIGRQGKEGGNDSPGRQRPEEKQAVLHYRGSCDRIYGQSAGRSLGRHAVFKLEFELANWLAERKVNYRFGRLWRPLCHSPYLTLVLKKREKSLLRG